MNTKCKGMNRVTWHCQLQYFLKSLSLFILVHNNIRLQKVPLLSQSDDECLKHSKYITDRTFLIIFLEKWESFFSSSPLYKWRFGVFILGAVHKLHHFFPDQSRPLPPLFHLASSFDLPLTR